MKLIALTPLSNCHPHLHKIIKPNTTYFFYNGYSIDADGIIHQSHKVPNNFFKSADANEETSEKNNIQVNISAIVGKNGSGKSTIIELLFRAINNIAYKLLANPAADLEPVEGLAVEIIFETSHLYKARVINTDISFFTLDKEGKLNTPVLGFKLKDFFYTIAVNYSLYAYNSNDIKSEGDWLPGLFHKNDGYQTPLVLNPFRKDGNIDINNENHLVKARLIANLLAYGRDGQENRKLTDRLYAHSLVLTLNPDKSNTSLYSPPGLELIKSSEKKELTLNDLSIDRETILTRLNKYFRFGYTKLNKNEFKLALNYILYKVVSIALKYYDADNYFLRNERRFNENKVDAFIKELYQDRSHITLKLRQTINFLKYHYIPLQNGDVNLDDYSAAINKILARDQTFFTYRTELMPPPIFNVEIMLTNLQTSGNTIPFKSLSSGEKQMLYSVNSFIYHIMNLDSVSSRVRKKISYPYLHIVLEEIELYAHPEMQRNYVQLILSSINRLPLNNVSGISFCIVTHSPFILSDIPHPNILFLNEEGSPEDGTDKWLTFGGNIHDLLAHSFFLQHSTIGAFAYAKIDEVISKIQPYETEPPQESVGDTKAVITKAEKDNIRDIIQLIGEPFLKAKLTDMYYSKFDKQKRIDELEAELKLLRDDSTGI